jgi:hypothetical protein
MAFEFDPLGLLARGGYLSFCVMFARLPRGLIFVCRFSLLVLLPTLLTRSSSSFPSTTL